MDEANAEYIREEVSDLFGFSLDAFSFNEIVDCSDKLTEAEKEWAKEHLDWKIYILDDVNKKLVNNLIDKAEGLRGLLEADFNAFENWNDEIDAFLDALDDLEGSGPEWECLKEK